MRPTALTAAGRFALVGGTATALHVIIVMGLVEGQVTDPLLANLIAFCLALAISYMGNHCWTFQAVGRHATYFPRFAAIALLGLGLNQGILFVTIETLALGYEVGLALVVLVVPALSFFANRVWAFAAPARRPMPLGWSKPRA